MILYALKSDTWNKVLKNIHSHKVSKNHYSELSIGDIGKSYSSLKPYGKGVLMINHMK